VIRWLLDTNVISEARKPRPSQVVAAWISNIEIECLCTTAVCIAELKFGAKLHPDQLVQADISDWIEHSLRPWFGNRIFPVDENVLLNWRILTRKNQLARHPTPPVDILIAAVAYSNDLAIATRDVLPFVACGAPVFNPWTGERFNGA
jgi:toxin FitB